MPPHRAGHRYPLGGQPHVRELLAAAEQYKAEYEAGLTPTSIDMRFGYEWALCCGVGFVSSFSSFSRSHPVFLLLLEALLF